MNRLCAQIADQHGWGFVNVNLRPYYSEGSKTLAYEIVQQLKNAAVSIAASGKSDPSARLAQSTGSSATSINTS